MYQFIHLRRREYLLHHSLSVKRLNNTLFRRTRTCRLTRIIFGQNASWFFPHVCILQFQIWISGKIIPVCFAGVQCTTRWERNRLCIDNIYSISNTALRSELELFSCCNNTVSCEWKLFNLRPRKTAVPDGEISARFRKEKIATRLRQWLMATSLDEIRLLYISLN